MADTDRALEEALALHDPTWSPPDTSEWMRRQRAELVVMDDDEADAAYVIESATGRGWVSAKGRRSS